MMTRFIEPFRELGRAAELLKTQVNLILVERLQQNWTKVRASWRLAHAGHHADCQSAAVLTMLSCCLCRQASHQSHTVK